MFSFLMDEPVSLDYDRSLLRDYGLLGVCTKRGNRYIVTLDHLLVRHPVVHAGVLFHELAHIRYNTFDTEGLRLREGLRQVWQRSGLLNADRAFQTMWNLLEDLRIEYQLMQEFPESVPYIAAMLNLIQYIPRPLTIWNLIFEFIRTGRVYEGNDDLYEYLWLRALFARRAPDAAEVARIANEIVAYVYSQYQSRASVMTHNARLNRSVLDAIKGRGRRGQGSLEVKPWGGMGYRGSPRHIGEGFREFVTKQASYAKRNREGQGSGGGLAYSNNMRILTGRRVYCSFAYSVMQQRASEIQRLVEIFKRLGLERRETLTREGEITPKHIQNAYVSSYTDDGMWLIRRDYTTGTGDVLIALDVSGSMIYEQEQALSDAIVLTRVFELLGYRVAFCTVADNMTLVKDFDDAFDYSFLSPRAQGGTNFHLFFSMVKKLKWKSLRRLICIVSDGAWYSGYRLDDPFYSSTLVLGIITRQSVNPRIIQFRNMEEMIREVSTRVRGGWFSDSAYGGRKAV